jgi:hypothetical protein
VDFFFWPDFNGALAREQVGRVFSGHFARDAASLLWILRPEISFRAAPGRGRKSLYFFVKKII